MQNMFFGYSEEPDTSHFDCRVGRKIDELIKEGMAAVGTDEEIVLFSWFSKGEISKADLRYSLYEEARMLVCDEIIEEGLSRDY